MKNLPIEQIKEDILGKRYELSFAFVNKARIKFLNKTYRQKNEATDILSFPLDKKSGEILICKEIAKIKSKKFGMTFADYLLFLVIHGNLHLKGLEHSDKMEKYELTYYSRYRRRNL
ncbi:MAG: rRNA maturation RNase YbeY [Candidatus Paceibacterota bacterium]|jgi:probable rRNA maturation factor